MATYTNVKYNVYKDVVVYNNIPDKYAIRGYFKLQYITTSEIRPLTFVFSNFKFIYSAATGWSCKADVADALGNVIETAATLSILLVGYYFEATDLRCPIAGIKSISYTTASETTMSQDCISCGKVWLNPTDKIQTMTMQTYPAQNWKLLCNDAFGVDDSGRMFAVDASIIGQINATSGCIGNFNIDSSGLTYTNNGKLIALTSQGLTINDNIYLQTDNWLKAKNGSGIYFDPNGSGEHYRQLNLSYVGETTEGSFWTGKYTLWTFSLTTTDGDATWATNGYDIPFTVWVKTQSGDQFSTEVVISKTADYSTTPLTIQVVSSTYYLGKQGANRTFGSFNAYGFSATETAALMTRKEWASELNLTIKGNLVPEKEEGATEDKYNLGSEAKPWNQVFANTGSWTTSDKNLKSNIKNISTKYDTIFDTLRPVTFKYKEGTSGRTHVGFIAQEVEKSIADAGLTTKDYACISKKEQEDGTINYMLRYEEFIALNTLQIQKLKARVAELEKKLEEK